MRTRPLTGAAGLVATLFSIVLGIALATPGFGLDEGQPANLTQQESDAALMEAVMRLAQPSSDHELLAALAGRWNQTAKWYLGPGQEPMTMSGACEAEMILGGRFLTMACEAVDTPMPIESFSIMGFDRRWQKYTVVGYDTVGTYYVTGAGPYDEATKTITLSGKDEDPVVGITQIYDIIIHLISDDEHATEIIFHNEEMTGGTGEPFKAVEVTYTRVR